LQGKFTEFWATGFLSYDTSGIQFVWFLSTVFCTIHIAAYRIIAGSIALFVDLNILQLIQRVLAWHFGVIYS